MSSKNFISIKTWQIEDIENSIAAIESDSVYLSFHHMVHDDGIGDCLLLAVTEPVPVGEAVSSSASFVDLEFELESSPPPSGTTAHILAVIHSTNLEPSYIGSAVIEIVTGKFFSQQICCDMDFEVPIFSKPKLTITMTFHPTLYVVFIPVAVRLNQAHGIVGKETNGDSVSIGMRLGNKQCSKLAVNHTEYVGGWKVFAPIISGSEQMAFPIRYNPTSKDKIEIYVEGGGHDESSMTTNHRLIDVLPIGQLRVGEPVSVGADNEGFIVLYREEKFPDPLPPLIYDREHKLFRLRRFYIQIDFLPDTWREGTIEVVVVVPVCNLSSRQSIVVESDTVVIDMNPVFVSAEDVPVVGMIIRNSQGQLLGLYTISLRKMSNITFPGEPIVLNMGSEEVEGNEEHRLVYLRPNLRDKMMVDENFRRYFVTVGSGRNLPTYATGTVFVTLMTVSLDVPPVLLRSEEVLKFLNRKRDGILSADSCERSGRMGGVVWESDVEIDAFNENWFYYIIYAQRNGEVTVPIAHGCFPKGSERSETAVVVPIGEGRDIPRSAFGTLTVSFRSKPWTGLWVYQDMDNSSLRLFEEEVRLDVEVLLHRTDQLSLRQSHIWLPIKNYVPLYLADCPPNAWIKARLMALNGALLGETSARLTDKDTTQMIVCGIAFILSRSKLFP